MARIVCTPNYTLSQALQVLESELANLKQTVSDQVTVIRNYDSELKYWKNLHQNVQQELRKKTDD